MLRDEQWYVGAQNDALYIIDKPPRPSNDDINPNRDVAVVAKVYGETFEEQKARANLLASAPTMKAALAEIEVGLEVYMEKYGDSFGRLAGLRGIIVDALYVAET